MKLLKVLVFASIAVFLMVSDYKFSYFDNIKKPISIIITPIYFIIDLPAEFYAWINKRDLDNDDLIAQNQQLKSEIRDTKIKLQTYYALLSENQKLNKLLSAKYKVRQKDLSFATISKVSQSRLKKQIVINKGSSDGLKIGQVALGVDGIAGQITQISPFNSTILLITDPTQFVAVKSQRNGIRGVSKGLASNKNSLIVNFIEQNADIIIGDIFISSAIGSKFPANHPIGEVVAIKKDPNSPFLDIQLKPIQNINKMEFVLIIR